MAITKGDKRYKAWLAELGDTMLADMEDEQRKAEMTWLHMKFQDRAEGMETLVVGFAAMQIVLHVARQLAQQSEREDDIPFGYCLYTDAFCKLLSDTAEMNPGVEPVHAGN